MAEESGGLTAAGAWGQAVAAVAVVSALGVGLWTAGEQDSSSTTASSSPATCSEGESRTATPTPGKAGRTPVLGQQLCEVLNRSDLAELLGTPGELVKSANGSDSSVRTGSGKEIATPSAKVELPTYTVNLEATYDRLPVAGSASLLGSDARPRTFLDRPAVLYSSRTLSIRFRLDGSDAESGPGVPARVLSVAQDAGDSGGSYELSIWREDGGVPDDATLLHVAETVLPTLPGWTGDGA
ncbi:hypothetical protein HUT18_16230 [Streptomyces sp. NA04227]|uniref:DUF6215 domain-containing protein n=1 Tax=Streptomyces sp. NA04227 TaxID=2742136 RepID=UPI001590008D|nr:DUF6215 domain-containing protein [Streptomyces sp. NA04227]QKW07699.1 hypothetical protein HUT18_16230 [Streptomyces sp. NA04227]